MSLYMSYFLWLVDTAPLKRAKVSLCCKAPDFASGADGVNPYPANVYNMANSYQC